MPNFFTAKRPGLNYKNQIRKLGVAGELFLRILGLLPNSQHQERNHYQWSNN